MTPWTDFGPEDDATDSAELEALSSLSDLRRRFPRADLSLVPYLRDLLATAESYHLETGRHLDVYGGIGALFAAVVYGLRAGVRSPADPGSVGIRVRTLTPLHDPAACALSLPLDHLTALVVVRVRPGDHDGGLRLSGRLIGRDALPAPEGGVLFLGWGGICVPRNATAPPRPH